EAGIRSDIDETPAMPLGTVAVSPLELATAYAAFAGLGEVAPPRFLLRIAAGKTGTTADATDTWFVGYTPRLVAAVWMGFDEPRPIMGLATGGRLAAPVWGRMMVRAPESLTTRAAWATPSSVVQAWIDPQSGRPLTDGCRPYNGDALRELFLRTA